jgi:DNA primase
MLEDLSYINCRDLLESTGIHNISESGGEITFSCPSAEHFHGDTTPSARMNSRTSAFLCHSCGVRGNAITFLAWHKSLPETVARRLLEERYGGGLVAAGVGNLEDMVKKIMNPEIMEEEKRIPPDIKWLGNFSVKWDFVDPIEEPELYQILCYLCDRGFNSDILNRWQIGHDVQSDRITIPIRDHEGKLVGFKGRHWRKGVDPRYMILGDRPGQNRYGFQPYQKSHYVFGLDKITEQDSYDKCEVIIVEGELNVIAMDQHGYFMTVGISGSEFSDKQKYLISNKCGSAILFLDNDKAGNKGTKKVIEMLSPYMPIKIVQDAPGDAAELDKDTVGSLITGAKSALELQVEGKL